MCSMNKSSKLEDFPYHPKVSLSHPPSGPPKPAPNPNSLCLMSRRHKDHSYDVLHIGHALVEPALFPAVGKNVTFLNLSTARGVQLTMESDQSPQR